MSAKQVVQVVQGSERTLANGARVRQVRVRKLDGSLSAPVTRIISGATNMAAVRAFKNVAISSEQAQAAFNRFYGRTQKHHRGAVKGTPIFKSPRGRKSAKTYDLGHTSAKVVSDARYLRPIGPRSYDFTGVDTGSKVRKPLSANQLTALATARAKLANKRAQRGGNQQVAGYWW
jgi:hypothetical protein